MYRLHCFAQSGNCFKVAFMLRALGVPYESHYVDYLKGTTREPTWRESVNEMGEIPVLEEGDRRLTQSGAILTYLAAKHGRFGGANKHLEEHRFLVGPEPTIADFSLSGYLFYPLEESGYDYVARYPSIAAWIERLKAVPGWAPPYDALPGARVAPKW